MSMKPEDYTQFRKSEPWGYYPPEVEERIRQYEETINALNEKYMESIHVCSNLKQDVNHLQEQLRDLHLQISFVELPEPSEAVEHFVLDDFKSYNSGRFDDIEPPAIAIDNESQNGENGETDSFTKELLGNADKNNKSSFVIVQ